MLGPSHAFGVLVQGSPSLRGTAESMAPASCWWPLHGCHAFAGPAQWLESVNHHGESMRTARPLDPLRDARACPLACFRRTGSGLTVAAWDRRKHGTRRTCFRRGAGMETLVLAAWHAFGVLVQGSTSLPGIAESMAPGACTWHPQVARGPYMDAMLSPVLHDG